MREKKSKKFESSGFVNELWVWVVGSVVPNINCSSVASAMLTPVLTPGAYIIGVFFFLQGNKL